MTVGGRREADSAAASFNGPSALSEPHMTRLALMEAAVPLAVRVFTALGVQTRAVEVGRHGLYGTTS